MRWWAKPLRGHEDWVELSAVSMNGTCIVSGGSGGTMREWDFAAITLRPFSFVLYVMSLAEYSRGFSDFNG
jgi:WD40 repeat protein